ncbi:polysaccharide lyase 6 family protein [Polaribacter dokdonensis]|uniref:Alginate lyase, family PL6 n=1 Tax=Polaribacter dokdonensis DSW-5 TaxID=1300348 RepID=A0A0N0CF81_9FLAO|nr:chondroitinase-B domain-containing protein [Polaribacter dokdonensis]KOY51414.1 Alginate lyase, family PL6 [Polaribacter dokdonensis DSW-5]SEE11920.1 poly(beta-D-mannuronate) lyase [Polaribacter dokdonensis DSW-5]
MRNSIFTLTLIFLTTFCFAQQEILVSNTTEYNVAIKKATAGTTIVLKNGVWTDVSLEAFGAGTEAQPITIKAEKAGEVILAGNSSIKIYGTYIIVEGLWFKDGNPTKKSIVQFRKNSKEFANNCRFTHNTISYYNPEDTSINSHWVDLWGKNNRVDHNNFTGKTNDGTTLVVWLKGEEHVENNHQIDHNFFGKRPELGTNGGETIRIGTSANSMKSSKTIVENNTFQNCDGEIEIISNKSADNIFRNNLFVESQGTLTLRHGNNALVEDNVFIGNNVKRTGGIRIINEGHIVRNNLLIGLKGDGFRGPIVIMNGVPNSPLNRYNQVKNVNVQNNTIINCGPIALGAGKDDERSLPPINSIFANNLVTNTDGSEVLEISDDISGIKFFKNILDSSASADAAIFQKQTVDWKLLQSIPMPTANNPSLISNYKDNASPEKDIVGYPRKELVAGAFNLGNKRFPKALLIRTGPYWKPVIEVPEVVIKEKEIKVEPGTNTFAKALKKATAKTTMVLTDGIYFIDKTQKIKGDITIKGSAKTIIKANDDLPKALNYFFRVQENATLRLQNLIIDGDNDTKVKYAVVSPDKQLSETYNLFVDNCTFQNFTNTNGGSIYKAYVGTLADTISIRNSTFKDSYRGLNLSYEKNNFAKYNANTILIHNTVFDNIDEFAINYVKTGPLINNSPAKLVISNSVFSNVNNSEKGNIIRLKSIPTVIIKNSVFENSYKIKTPVSLYGKDNIIENSLINLCGKIKVNNGAKSVNLIYRSPKWDDKNLFIPSKKSPLLKSNNDIEDIGLIQTKN